MTEPHKRFSLKYIITAEDITTTGKVGEKRTIRPPLRPTRLRWCEKIFFTTEKRWNFVFFHLRRRGTSTGNTPRLLIRGERIVPKLLRRWVVSRMAVGVSSPHFTIRSQLSCPPFHTVFFVVEKNSVHLLTLIFEDNFISDIHHFNRLSTVVFYKKRVYLMLIVWCHHFFSKGHCVLFFRPYSIAVARDTHFL